MNFVDLAPSSPLVVAHFAAVAGTQFAPESTRTVTKVTLDEKAPSKVTGPVTIELGSSFDTYM
jgi:hypothetical protein